MQVTTLLSKINSATFLNDYLEANGIDDVESYLHPHAGCFDYCWGYPNMLEAVNLLGGAVYHHYKIGILADSDADGQYSATIMYLFLKELGVTPVMFYHVGKQHGLRPSKEENIVEQVIEKGIDLLIIPDASSNDAKECKELHDNGVEVLILDHHEITTPNPHAVIVNHHLGEGLNTALSGTGVVAKFVQAYCMHYMLPTPYYNDLVAASIISDVCDLSSLENRAYVADGLTHLTHPTLKLMTEKLCNKGVNPEGLAWGTNPPINALTRGDNFKDKVKFFEAMVGLEEPKVALTVARRAHRIQTEEVKRIMAEVDTNIDNSHKVIIAYCDPKDKNYTGLVANKLMSKYSKPIILLRQATTTTWSGSIRSTIDLASKINKTGLATCQGHEQACGILVKKSNLSKLRQFLDTLDLSTTPSIPVTASILPKQITPTLCRICEDNKILWGHGLPAPTWHIKGRIDPNSIQFFEKRTTTIKFTIDGVAFLKFMASETDVETFKSNPKTIEMVVTLGTNEWNGVVSCQGIVDRYEVVENEDDDWMKAF